MGERAGRMRRVTVRTACVFASLLAATAIAGLLFLHSNLARRRLRTAILGALSMGGRLEASAGTLKGDLLRGVRLPQLRITGPNGPILEADRVAIAYGPMTLWRALRGRPITLREVDLDGAHVVVRQLSSGHWELAGVGASQAQARQPPSEFTVEKISATQGHVDVIPLDGPPIAVDDISLTCPLAAHDGVTRMGPLDLTLHAGKSTLNLAGEIAFGDGKTFGMEGHVTAHIEPPLIARFFSDLQPDGPLDLDATVTGDFARLSIHGVIKAPSGRARVDAVVTSLFRSAAIDLDLRDLDLERIFGGSIPVSKADGLVSLGWHHDQALEIRAELGGVRTLGVDVSGANFQGQVIGGILRSGRIMVAHCEASGMVADGVHLDLAAGPPPRDIAGVLSIDHLTVASLPIDAVRAAVSFSAFPVRLTLDSMSATTPVGTVTARGWLDGARTFSLSADLPNAPLSALSLAFGGPQRLAGRADLTLDASGPLASPSIELGCDAHGLSGGATARVRASVARGAPVHYDAHVDAAGGTLTSSGDAGPVGNGWPDKQSTVHGTVVMSHFPGETIDPSLTGTQIDGSLSLSGTVANPQARGHITLPGPLSAFSVVTPAADVSVDGSDLTLSSPSFTLIGLPSVRASLHLSASPRVDVIACDSAGGTLSAHFGGAPTVTFVAHQLDARVVAKPLAELGIRRISGRIDTDSLAIGPSTTDPAPLTFGLVGSVRFAGSELDVPSLLPPLSDVRGTLSRDQHGILTLTLSGAVGGGTVSLELHDAGGDAGAHARAVVDVHAFPVGDGRTVDAAFAGDFHVNAATIASGGPLSGTAIVTRLVLRRGVGDTGSAKPALLSRTLSALIATRRLPGETAPTMPTIDLLDGDPATIELP